MLNWRQLGRFACPFSLLVGVVSWAQPSAATKIACVGDSITYGYNLSNPSQQSWPAVLQTLVGSADTVQNFGSSGCTLLKAGDKPYWNDPAYSASDAFKPELVIVMLGTNDAKPLNWSHKADFASDYKSLITHYRTLGAQVYVAAPPPVYAPGAFDINPDVVSGEVVPLIHQIATDADAPLIDVFQALSNKSSYFPDTVHPNVAGSQLIAQTVAAALQQSGVGGAGGATSTGGTAATTGGKVGVGGASSSTGGATGVGGATKGLGGTATNTGGTASSIGGVANSGGTGRGTGGTTSSIATTSGTGGTLKGSGGTATSTVSLSSSAGGTSGIGGTAKGIGGAATSAGGMSSGIGSTSGTGGTTSTVASATASVGGAGATSITSASSTGAQVELLGGTGNANSATGSGRPASGGNSGLGASPTGSRETTANASGCNCRVFGKHSVHQRDYLGALLLLTLLRIRRRNH